MYNTENSDGSYQQDVQFYRQWLHMGDSDAPTFADNLKWMFSWQMGQMYFRYFCGTLPAVLTSWTGNSKWEASMAMWMATGPPG